MITGPFRAIFLPLFILSKCRKRNLLNKTQIRKNVLKILKATPHDGVKNPHGLAKLVGLLIYRKVSRCTKKESWKTLSRNRKP